MCVCVCVYVYIYIYIYVYVYIPIHKGILTYGQLQLYSVRGTRMKYERRRSTEVY